MTALLPHEADAESWTFPLCPAPPAWTLDWPAVEARFGWIRALGGCPQNPLYHAEGDVLVHTRLVAEALVGSAAWRALAPGARSVLFAAALLHDVAKPLRTVVAEDGAITSRGHARRGAHLARQLLWLGEDGGVDPAPFSAREAVVGLVRYHGLPLWVLDDADPQRAVIRASMVARCDLLALLAEADVRGRRCADSAELLGRIDLFRELCQENGCLDKPYAFPSAHSRFVYFHRAQGSPTYAAYDDTRCEVVLMSGLPGSGKDHWIRAQRPGWPVIALDALRLSMQIGPQAEQGPVIAAAREQARAYLRSGRSFIWNATNTTRALRERLVDFFISYGARARIVYLEVPFAELLERNAKRARPVPEPVIRRLAARLDVPNPTEAHAVEWVIASPACQG
jgi:predicted kinase